MRKKKIVICFYSLILILLWIPSATIAQSFVPEIATFNRVDAWRFGLRVSYDISQFTIGGKYTYATGANQSYYTFDGAWHFTKKWQIGLQWQDESIPIDPSYAGRFMTTLGTLWGKTDYNDYYHLQGLKSFLKYRYNRKFSGEFSLNWERHLPLHKTTDYSFFSPDNQYRENPYIDPGYFYKADLTLYFSKLSNPLRPIWGHRITPTVQLMYGDWFFYKLRLQLEKYFKIKRYQRLRLDIDAVYIDSGAPYEELYSFSGFKQLPGIGVRQYILDRALLLNLQYNFDGTIIGVLGDWFGENLELAPAFNAGYGELASNTVEGQNGTSGVIPTLSLHLKEKYDMFEFVIAGRLDIQSDIKFYLSIEIFDLMFGDK